MRVMTGHISAATPVRLRRLKSEDGQGMGLEIEWSSGEVFTLKSQQIRENCPCASCGESRGQLSHAKPLSAPPSGKGLLRVIEATSDQELNLTKLWNVGSYAIGIQWGDGHDSGIYSFPVLREICLKSCGNTENSQA